MKELLTSYKHFVSERLSTPFFANILFSWCIYNWEIVYLTLFVSEQTIAPFSKIGYISHYYLDPQNLYWRPLWTGIAVTLSMPTINMIVFWWRKGVKTLRRIVEVKIAKMSVIVPEEYWDLDNRLKEVQDRYNESINSYRNKVGEIRNLKEEQNKSNETLQGVREELDREVMKNRDLMALHSLDFLEKAPNMRVKFRATKTSFDIKFRDNYLYADNINLGKIDMIQNDAYLNVSFRVTTADGAAFIYVLKKISNVEFDGVRYNLVDGKQEHVTLSITG